MAFADLQDLEDQLDFDLDEQSQRSAVQKLQQASDYASHYAGVEWPESRCPRIVKSIVLNVVERYVRNPDGYTQSRAGDETLMWDDTGGRGTFFFTDEEKEILVGLGRRGPKLYSVGTYYESTAPQSNTIWVPVAGTANPPGTDGGMFPLFSDQDPML